MAGKSKRPKLTLSPEELEQLERLGRSSKAEVRQARRARILTRYHAGEPIAQIARSVDLAASLVAADQPSHLRSSQTRHLGQVLPTKPFPDRLSLAVFLAA